MITIEHCKNNQIEQRPKRLVAIEMTRKEYREGLHSYSYLAGEDPPHFPVPAIITRWQYDADGPFCVEYREG